MECDSPQPACLSLPVACADKVCLKDKLYVLGSSNPICICTLPKQAVLTTCMLANLIVSDKPWTTVFLFSFLLCCQHKATQPHRLLQLHPDLPHQGHSCCQADSTFLAKERAHLMVICTCCLQRVNIACRSLKYLFVSSFFFSLCWP